MLSSRRPYAFNLDPKLIEKLNSKIGYANRSKLVEELIEMFVKSNKKQKSKEGRI